VFRINAERFWPGGAAPPSASVWLGGRRRGVGLTVRTLRLDVNNLKKRMGQPVSQAVRRLIKQKTLAAAPAKFVEFVVPAPAAAGCVVEVESALRGQAADGAEMPGHKRDSATSACVRGPVLAEAGVDPSSEEKRENKKTARKPGHGRNGTDAYSGAERKPVRHARLNSGDICPECEKCPAPR